MTAHADILYLPTLMPTRIEMGVGSPLPQGSGTQSRWRRRLHNVGVQPRPIQGTAYGPDGRVTNESQTGGLIDIFA